MAKKIFTDESLSTFVSEIKTYTDTIAAGKANSSHGNHVPTVETADNAKFLRNDNTWAIVTPTNIGAAEYSHTHRVATSSAGGFMSASDKSKLDSIDKSKLDGIEAGANAYTHPSYPAIVGEPTRDETPAFGGHFWISQPVSDATGHITELNTRIITIPNTQATTSAAGLMSASDKIKLGGIATGATKVIVDSALSSSSTNPVQNKIINSALDSLGQRVTSLEDNLDLEVSSITIDDDIYSNSYGTPAFAWLDALESRVTETETQLDAKQDAISTESWTFTLEDGSTVTKAVFVG